VDVRVVRGSDRTAVDSHVGVALHVDSLSSDARLWRGEPQWFGGEPLAWGADSTRYGEVIDADGSKVVVRTYTDPSGGGSTTIQSSPGPVERWQHGAAQWLPALSVPVIGGFVVYRRRRRA